MAIVWWILAALCYLLLSSAFSFYRNLCLARRTQLPILASPVSRLNLVWIILQQPLKPLLRSLPFELGSFTRWNTLTWWFIDRYRLHQQYGKVFLHVSPGVVELHSADPQVNRQIFAKRNEIDKTPDLMKASRLGFGDSLTSVTGQDWVRHRRATIPQFNERNNKLVWNESVRQAVQVGKYFSDFEKDGCSSTTYDWLTVTLNILVAGALGESWDFKPHSTEGAKKAQKRFLSSNTASLQDSKIAYHDSIGILCGSLALYVLTPFWMFSVSPKFLPGSLKEYIMASNSFKKSMEHMIEDAKNRINAGGIGNDATFLTNLVLRSEEMRLQRKVQHDGQVEDFEIPSKGGLSQEEVYGNIFLYNLAGHETTASTLGYAVYLFAAFPAYQEWLCKEIDYVYKQKSDVSIVDYSEVFPKLKRTMSIMMETLRLYGPINAINKAVVTQYDIELQIEGRSVSIPPKTLVIPNVIASHTLPEFWGPDHLEWKPERWIQTKADFTESILDPPSGKDTYFPWSSGGRSCPGKKFSQVEFIGIISVVLKLYRVEVVPLGKETAEMAQKRCYAVIEDSQTEITLRMKNPQSVNLRFIERVE